MRSTVLYTPHLLDFFDLTEVKRECILLSFVCAFRQFLVPYPYKSLLGDEDRVSVHPIYMYTYHGTIQVMSGDGLPISFLLT